MRNIIEKLDTSIVLQVFSLVILLVLAATSGSQAATGSAETQINRYVLAVSANNGGKGRPMLRYAESDAKSFVNVLKEMGGVQPQNIVFVKGPSVEKLRHEMDALDKKIAQGKSTGGRNEVLVYYSGHADDKGLRLGEEVYNWKEFRKRIDALNGDVKIAVIDACGSGAITRLKGGVAVPAFMVDKSSDMKGYAFITSSTQDESSQESDKLKGSFFTHSLVSGLRGAGDASGDGRVTLSEAYQFAFNETLQKTETTLGGAQHPSRDMNLAGTGDVVMTDLRSTSAGLDLDEDVDGRLFIRDEKGELVAELYKKGGRAMSLGFPAGKYSVRMERPAEYKEATVTLQDNYRARLSQKQFAAVSAEKTTLRGGTEFKPARTCAAGDTNQCSLDSLDRNGTSRTTFNLYDHDKEPRKGVQLGLFATRADDYLIGSQVSFLVNSANKDMRGLQVTGLINLGENVDGAQISGTVNYAESFQGLQFGFVNWVNDKSDGVQIGYVNAGFDTVGPVQVGFVDFAKQTDVQIGFVDVAGASDVQVGFVDVAPKSDVQVGFVDVAGRSDVQVGFVNASYKEGGTQVGYVNTATVSKGRQVGFVNVCLECEKTPVGFVSIVGNGVWSGSAYVNEMGALGLSLHLGTAYFYTAFEGARQFEKGTNFEHFSDTWESGFGVGTQFGTYGSHFELEYMHFNVFDRFRMNDVDAGYHHRLRLGYVYSLLPGIGLGVGGTVNVATQGYQDDVILKPLGNYHDDAGSKNHKGRVWPGFYSGITVGKF
ncbi:caspase family protein [Fibrobacter sp. UWP2]|uniref:caspase family protein n=1 Tax=Fibrobacter sp. UWP2 TaxID=1896216 RepID=UPI00091E0046|nr:caspase family protein [Fibrobacter sp. UWP2]SHI80071.1 Caspase domain-containing protein [Fibrobacter sp. UWP2]